MPTSKVESNEPLPAAIELTDVTLRDGLQMESRAISLADKETLLRKLSQCGYSRLEITSFVNPKWVPQFADSDEFCRRIVDAKTDSPEWMAFVPNERGLERLLAFPIPWVSCFVAVSETFNKKNVNQSIAETLVGLAALVSRAKREGRKVRVYVSTVFGCPYEGRIAATAVSDLVKRVADLQPDEISLGDTIGVAVPEQVREVLGALLAFYPRERLAVHFHNTYGLALAGAQVAYDLGIRKMDGSTGGIGGCPYAKGATGNAASEELLYLFSRQHASEFRADAIYETLKFTARDLKLKVNSHLFEIWEKGGRLYET